MQRGMQSRVWTGSLLQGHVPCGWRWVIDSSLDAFLDPYWVGLWTGLRQSYPMGNSGGRYANGGFKSQSAGCFSSGGSRSSTVMRSDFTLTEASTGRHRCEPLLPPVITWAQWRFAKHRGCQAARIAWYVPWSHRRVPQWRCCGMFGCMIV